MLSIPMKYELMINVIIFFITDLPKPACQNCPSVEEYPTMKTVLDTLCQHDFGKQPNITSQSSHRGCISPSCHHSSDSAIKKEKLTG